MQSQDKDLEERIKRRRMRSEAGKQRKYLGSVGKFKHLKGQTVEGNIAGEKLN